MLFVSSLGWKQSLRLMPLPHTPPPPRKTQYPLSLVMKMKAGILVCVVVVLFWVASFSASY